MEKNIHKRESRPTGRSVLYLLVYLWISSALPELILHFSTAGTLAAAWNPGLILAPGFSLALALFIGAVILAVDARWFTKVTLTVFSLLSFLLCASQVVYFRIFGCFYSAFSLFNSAQVAQFWSIALKHTLKALPILILMALPLIYYFIWGRKLVPRHFPWPRIFALMPALAAVSLQILLVSTLGIWEGTGPISPHSLYHSASDSFYGIQKLGFFTSFHRDTLRLVTGEEADSEIILDAADPITPTEIPETVSPEVPSPIGPTYNVLPLDFDLLVETTADMDLQDLHRYFGNRTPSSINEKTGLFDGCNLIMITAEAFSHLLVSETRTPTLYKLMNDGFRFTNYYVPDWPTSTTDGEYVFLTGTIPKANSWSFYQSADNHMPLTMSRQLIAKGYGAYAYHGHTYDYYHRDEYLENLGFAYKAYGKGLNVKKTWPESDLEVTDLSTGDFAAKEPFVAYYMTISGHREYNFGGNVIAAKNKSQVAEEPYSNAVKAYLACQLELEKSLTLLLQRLEEAGTLENTVIVLTADHRPNGLTNEEFSELLGHSVDPDFELYQNGCIIYKPGMTPETIDTPCSHLDLLPTLSNLFGLEFDSRLYMGRDIFSEAEPLVIFGNRSWITELARYNAQTGEAVSLTGTPVTEEYIHQINTEVNNRFAVSTQILDLDYWKILFQ